MSIPLDELFNLAERSYIRLEAEQLINECLDQGDFIPFDNLLQELVLAGSSSLSELREVHGAIRSVKSALSQEGMGIRQNLVEALSEFGVHLPQLLSPNPQETFWQICSKNLHREVLKSAGKLDVGDETLLEEICVEAANRVALLASRSTRVNQLEATVLDWIDGLVYECAHSAEPIPLSDQQSQLH